MKKHKNETDLEEIFDPLTQNKTLP